MTICNLPVPARSGEIESACGVAFVTLRARKEPFI